MQNRYVVDLLDQMEDRFSADSLNMSMSDWVCKNTTLRSRPFSLKGYEFQRQILDDMHPNMDVIKISQVGMTEIQIRKALAFLKRNNGTSLIFSLPDENMYKRVSNSRVKPIVNKDKIFTTPQDKANKATRSIDMMQLGQSFLYLTASIESAATSIPADVVFIDEVDLSDQKMVSLFNSRMQNSTFKIMQRFSTPSFPSYGVDLGWQSSDQHLYMHRCECCGHWAHPEFEHKFIYLPNCPEKDGEKLPLTDITESFQDEIDLTQAYVKCEKCHEPLDLANPDLREWVAEYPSRTLSRGYRIGPFSTAKIDVPYIFTQMWRYQKNEHIRGFYNTVLGVPYSDGSIQIPREAIETCMTPCTERPAISSYDDLWVGIDMGKICHVTIGRGPDSENLEIIHMYQIHSHEIVSHCIELVNKYNIRAGCVDRHPFEPTANEIFVKTGGRIIPVEYRGTKNINIVKDEYENLSHAQVGHTWFLDNFATKIRQHKLPISGYGYQKQVVIEHFRDMVRDETPEEPAKWMKLKGHDHYFHSSAFMCVAPMIAEIVYLKSDAEKRTMALSNMVQQKDETANIIGISKKRLDKLGAIR